MDVIMPEIFLRIIQDKLGITRDEVALLFIVTINRAIMLTTIIGYVQNHKNHNT